MLKSLKTKAEEWVSDYKKNQKSFGKIKMCKICHTFYYKNSWHFERPEYLDRNDDQEIPVRFTECPACLIEQENLILDDETNYKAYKTTFGLNTSNAL